MSDQPKKPRNWCPRFWEGSDFFAWLRLLWRNRLAVEPQVWYIAAIVSCKSFLNTCLRWSQQRAYAFDIADAVVQPPLFVLGHWRTGTTLLHELLILDDRYTYPSTLHCFEPCHFLLSEEVFTKHLQFLLPDKRPMDNMATGWTLPQEDEFALCLLGEPSTYTDLAFPNRPGLNDGALDLSGLSRRQLSSWKRTLRQFVRTLAVRDPRPLVLKSPPHTARIPALLDLFPGAKFVHIVRDPYVLFASTVNLWTSMGQMHGFQWPRRPDLIEEKVFREFRVIYERVLEDRKLIPEGHYCEVRYEDLVPDLVSGMESVYESLTLGGIDAVRPKLEQYAARKKGYATNKYQLTDEQRAKVKERWGDLIERLGY
jgi:omega-hydroxy-beta-dihydromenaquinone-9 sulfotransferase